MAPRTRLFSLSTFANRARHSSYRAYSSTPQVLDTPSSNSVDPLEVSHFSKLASSWWDPHGPSRLLHQMNPLRHSFISSCFASQGDAFDHTRKLSYLDVGCGGGIFAESAARMPNAGRVLGIDPTAEVLNVAEEHARRDPSLAGILRYRNIGIETLSDHESHESEARKTFQDGPARGHGDEGFDVVSVFEVIEHVSQPMAFLDKVGEQVKPGGWLVMSTIARTWTSWLTTKLAAEEILGIVPRGTHEWEKYINERELRKHFDRRGGWTSARAMGVVYVPALGWRQVSGGEEWGNYFFAVRKPLNN